MKLFSINPFTEETEAVVEGHTKADVEQKLQNAADAQKRWQNWSFIERKKVMKKAARVLLRRKKELAELMTREMGKPLTQSVSELEKCARTCEHFAENAEKYLQPLNVKTEARKSYVSFEPLGVILGIMPWNFPFWQVFRFAAPTLMAGNGIVVKHASNVPRCAMKIESVFREAGFPRGLFSTLLIDSKTALNVIDDVRIAGVSVTGSTTAGKQIASRAGMNIKKCVLELGGSDPFIVLDKNVSVQDCALSAVEGRMTNNGQSCVAIKRFIVPAEMASEFEREMKKAFDSLVIGDPMDENTKVGPLARKDLVDNLHRQMKQSIRMGAKVLSGNQSWKGKGYFFIPTLLSRIKPTMPIFSEETFGPLAGVLRVQNAREAIEMANHTEYGLGATIWSSNIHEAEKWAHSIQAGNVFINKKVASDPRISFGGVKQSGFGRELGELGIKEFVNAKTIWIK